MLFLCLPAALSQAAFHVDYATYLGGSLYEQATGIAVDPAGNAYILGTTNSPDFPLTYAGFGHPSKNSGCTFITKLSPSGAGMIWSVCLANARAVAIALDPGQNVYVLTYDSALNSVITKLNASADHVIYSKSLGAIANAMTVDTAGNAYATGSAGAGFATTAGAYQTAISPGTCHGGAGVGMSVFTCSDAFVTKLAPDGSTTYATYLGGSGSDEGRAIAVDSQGNVWITGDTPSPNFPVTPGAFQSAFRGEVDLGPLQFGDAFVSRLDPSGSRLLYSTYLGGSAPDAGFAIAIDSAGAAYVAGGTQSPDFPTTPGAFQRVYGGGVAIPSEAGDAFVVKFNASGSVVYSTYVGGPQVEVATDIGVDANGSAYVNAYPGTSTLNMNTLSVLSPDGSAILHAASVPGLFALDHQGALYFAGQTLGFAFFPTPGVVQSKFGGAVDVSVVKIDFAHPPSAFVRGIGNAANFGAGTFVAPGELITIFGSGFDAGTKIFFDGLPAPIVYIQNDQINASVPFEIAGPTTAITLQSAGQPSVAGTMNVYEAVPALFTADGTGQGQAAVLNQDGTVNSSTNPAARGSVISVFLTGAGRMTPALPDGSTGPLSPPFPNPVLGTGSNVGQVVFAGAAPGLIAGIVQVNIVLSAGLNPGDRVPLVLYIGNYQTGAGNGTIAVR